MTKRNLPLKPGKPLKKTICAVSALHTLRVIAACKPQPLSTVGQSPQKRQLKSGVEICTAAPSITGGFKDAAAAREHARNKGHFKKHVKLAAEAIGRNDLAEARRYMGTVPEPEKPQAKVTRLAANVPTKGKAATEQDSGAVEIPASKTLQELFPIKKVVNGSDCEHDTETAAALWEKGAAKLYGKKSVL